MHYQKIAKDQLSDVYHTHLRRDFISAELKPVSFLEEKFDCGAYFGYFFYHQDELVAYTLFGKTPSRNYLLLDYLAVLPEHRGKGYGSEILEIIKKETVGSDGVIIEAEAVEKAKDEKERAIRARRMAFYENNGLKQTRLFSEINGVIFSLLLLPGGIALDRDKVKKELSSIYHTFYDKGSYSKSWHIY